MKFNCRKISWWISST